MTEKVKLGDFIGVSLEENFMDFDLSEIQDVLMQLRNNDAIDLAHAELLQQQSLRGADILTEYLGRIVKAIGVLEAKINTAKNKAALEYKAPDGARTTTDMRIWYSAIAPEVEELQIALSKAKASKMVLDKKYDIIIKNHHYYKDIAAGLRKSILGYTTSKDDIPEGY